jgi:microcystin-dependent protein
MVTFTTNKALTLPANSSFVGTWDVPVNGNMSILDAALGGFTTLTLNNGVTVLSTAQSQNVFLTLQSTLTGSCIIEFPVGVSGFYTVQNLCTGSSQFIVQLTVGAGVGQTIACPPYEPFDILVDGTNVKFRNFGRIGTYWEYAGSSVPAWVTGCSINPYLNCDGTTFSSATYPALANLIGTTLPDSRGRTRFNLSQGTGRITSTGGIDGTTLFAAGGSQSVALTSQNMPPVPITDPGHSHTLNQSGLQGGPNTAATGGGAGTGFTGTAVTNITAGSSSPTPAPVLPPGYVGGITLVRAG